MTDPDAWLEEEIELTALAVAHPDCDVRAALRGFAALVILHPPPATYRDGVGLVRCRACGHAIRDAAEGPLVSIRLHDVERMVWWISELAGLGLDTPATAALQTRLAQALGQSVGQVLARLRAEG